MPDDPSLSNHQDWSRWPLIGDAKHLINKGTAFISLSRTSRTCNVSFAVRGEVKEEPEENPPIVINDGSRSLLCEFFLIVLLSFALCQTQTAQASVSALHARQSVQHVSLASGRLHVLRCCISLLYCQGTRCASARSKPARCGELRSG